MICEMFTRSACTRSTSGTRRWATTPTAAPAAPRYLTLSVLAGNNVERCCCFNLDAQYEGDDAYSGTSGAALFVLTGNHVKR